MREELKKEIKRCQFLTRVYEDFGPEYFETNVELLKDISNALVALEDCDNQKESCLESLNKLKDWL